jgi:aminoglycoside 3-N-acetyltransferase
LSGVRPLVTVPTIAAGLAALGIKSGDCLLVHVSLSSIGQVHGGPQAVIEALIEAVGETGTLVMPTFTNGRFDPSEWGNPPAPEDQWQRIRFETPAYHSLKTPTDHTMSCVYELFRSWPGTVRTNHPHSSMAAWGKNRDEIVSVHELNDRLGESSPLARLYEMQAQVVFLGTGFATNTCFHLSEYRQEVPPTREYMIVAGVDEARELVRYTDVDTDSSRFEAIGAAFAEQCSIAQTTIGTASCLRFELTDAVDYAQQWLNQN